MYIATLPHFDGFEEVEPSKFLGSILRSYREQNALGIILTN